jgi:hypothetical protein
MRKTRTVLVCLTASVQLLACSESSTPDSETSATNVEELSVPDSIRQELVRLGGEDQSLRQGLTPEKMQDTLLLAEMLRGDSARTARLQYIIEEYGWPDSSRVGSDGARAAFVILQHSPNHEFQKKMMPVLERLAERGDVPRDDAAMLIDRVLMHDSLPQRYGTQFQMVDGRLVLYEVQDEVLLEERRKSMGLPPLEEYMRLMQDLYRTPVVRTP